MRDPQTEALASDSAAGIVGAIETLVAMRLQGADVDRFILSAIDMLMGTKCLSYEDALAFISIGYRLATGTLDQLRCGERQVEPSLEWSACFIERAYDFLYADGRVTGKLTAPHHSTLH